ncbi:S-linalool synthase-like [Bidens hawaiensis]|uniref:S-linalool synthase-like n=1 Tax=Bidens hawaiensis TaxID=980011 RepID=UPI004048FDB0
MEPSLASIHALVTKLKKELFSKVKSENHQLFVSPSAYDTAWLAMIPHPVEHYNPLFHGCLEWLVHNQKEEGYWGESGNGDLPPVDAISATIASMVVLRKWGVGAKNIEKGLRFINANMVDMLHDQRHRLPRWFSIVFPATIELAESSGIELNFCDYTKSLIAEISNQRQQILCKEEIADKWKSFPLLAYLETFQSEKYDVDQETITKHLSEDGSLFQSPSATAQAYISTRNPKCLKYLMSLVEKCPNGVPQKYPMDQELVELSMVDQVQRLGLSEYFSDEIDHILRKVYRSYMVKEYSPEDNRFIAEKLFKDSLAFRLFRMHGYNIRPSTFCWFLHDNEILRHLEHNYAQFSSVLYNVYKATDLVFYEENDVHDARSFSRKMLQKISAMKNVDDDDVVIFPNLLQMIFEELNTPWTARLDHLDHRMWIEQNKEGPLWTGKASFYKLSCVHNMELMQLALQNYKFKQLIYQNELEELKRWSKKWGLSEMGFGREKTLYCYFAVSASTCLPHDSLIRMLVAKSAILITVADDFFDMRGSLEELHFLIDAINRWDGEGLSGPSKVIFDVLDDLVRDITNTLVLHGKIDLTEDFRSLWKETFNSWLTETTWGRSGYIPSVDEYLQISMISIATHILVLTSSCFLNPSIPENKVKPQKYESITQSLMATTRLLNDIQSYQKEQEEGITNLVLLHFNQNPDASMDHAISTVKRLLDMKRNELLKHVFTDDDRDFPNQWKHLHLSCFKVFQMLFNSSNLYDTDSELQTDIAKAIYVSPKHELPKCTKPHTTFQAVPKKGNVMISVRYHDQYIMNNHQLSKRPMRNISPKVLSSTMFGLCFI